ncbi:MAG: anaerobic ribonucleoside-triphosphate reductase [Longicatena sp.]
MQFKIVVDEIEINSNEQLGEKDAKAYIAYVRNKNPRKEIASIDLNFEGEEVGLGYHLQPEGFEKIRRITGYLVGTVDRFNNGKRAEEHDRVKHA